MHNMLSAVAKWIGPAACAKRLNNDGFEDTNAEHVMKRFKNEMKMSLMKR